MILIKKYTHLGPNNLFNLHLLVSVATSQRGSLEMIYEDSGETIDSHESLNGS